MTQKSILVSVIILIIVFILFSITQLSSWRVEKTSSCAQSPQKEIKIGGNIDGFITFKIPQDWNDYYNGDPYLITDLGDFQGTRSITESVSSGDRPVSLSDINWQQVDFRLTEGDLINYSFINALEKDTEFKATQIDLEYFSGYSAATIIQDEPLSKANTGSVTYYLRPKIDSPKWNLIITKQSLGDESFESAVKGILETLSHQVF